MNCKQPFLKCVMYTFSMFVYFKQLFLECVNKRRIHILVKGNYENCNHLISLYLAQLETRNRFPYHLTFEIETPLLNKLCTCHWTWELTIGILKRKRKGSLADSNDGILYLDYSVSELLRPLSNILNTTQRFGKWMCSRPQVERWAEPTQLGPSERANS
jgi:hypothetical protein